MSYNLNVEKVVKDFVWCDRRLGDTPHLGLSFAQDGMLVELRFDGIILRVMDRQFELMNHRGFEDGSFSLAITRAQQFDANGGDVVRGLESHLLYVMAALVIYLNSPRSAQVQLFRELGTVLRAVRQSLGLSTRAVAENVGAPLDAVEKWEQGALSSNVEIYDWCQSLGLVCPPKKALVRVVEFSSELLKFLQEDPSRLRSLTPDEFERFAADRMDRMGYNVTLTGAPNRKDGGIDLIAVPKSPTVGSVVIAGQMKHHQGDQTTGRDAVDRLLAWKDSDFGVGLLVTNTAFTRDAIWTAQQERNARFLRLRDFLDLKRWLEGRFGEEEDWREIPDKIELAPGVVIEIPRPRITSVFEDERILRDIGPGRDFGGKR